MIANLPLAQAEVNILINSRDELGYWMLPIVNHWLRNLRSKLFMLSCLVTGILSILQVYFSIQVYFIDYIWQKYVRNVCDELLTPVDLLQFIGDSSSNKCDKKKLIKTTNNPLFQSEEQGVEN